MSASSPAGSPASGFSKRSWILVVGLCAVLSVVVGVRLWNQIRRGLPPTQDLVTGLIYFMEAHGGRFPAGEAEFLASDFVERIDEQTIRIRPRPATRFRRKPWGVPIRDLQRYGVAWGTDLSALTIDERGRVRDRQGREVVLVRWPDSPRSGRSYSRLLVTIHRQLTASSTQPATSAAP